MNQTTKELILHIDDDEANQYAVKRILEKAGYRVSSALTGREGLDKLPIEKPDLIILDIKLPDMNGFEMCRTLKADPETVSIPVLQTSALFIKSEHKVIGLESGADGYLAQPIDGGVLVATVRSLLRIRKAEKEAQEATRAREEMLGVVSHDLRNPLSFIKMQTTFMNRMHKNGDLTLENSLERINKIEASVNRMHQMIQDLLDRSSLEDGKIVLYRETTSALGILNELNSFFSERISENGQNLVLDFPEKDFSLRIDRERIFQALENIISNAMKFTPKEGTITLGAKETSQSFLFFLGDSGIGISQEDMKKIFDRYWSKNKEDKKSFGLGLNIVKNIITAHEAKIWVESKMGEGSVFYFEFPKS
jgi:two-component system, sensor histidine kinase